MLCPYADIVMADFDKGDTFVLWLHGRESLVLFLDYINTLDTAQKIKFTMEVAEPGDYLEFLDLKT